MDDGREWNPGTGLILNADGQRIVKRGGDRSLEKLDAQEADDTLLQMEILQRAPNMSQADHMEVFIALRLEYGENALEAVRKGYVKFEKVSSRDMPSLPEKMPEPDHG